MMPICHLPNLCKALHLHTTVDVTNAEWKLNCQVIDKKVYVSKRDVFLTYYEVACYAWRSSSDVTNFD